MYIQIYVHIDENELRRPEYPLFDIYQHSKVNFSSKLHLHEINNCQHQHKLKQKGKINKQYAAPFSADCVMQVNSEGMHAMHENLGDIKDRG